jgi:hypothetical protein
VSFESNSSVRNWDTIKGDNENKIECTKLYSQEKKKEGLNSLSLDKLKLTLVNRAKEAVQNTNRLFDL